MGNGKQYVIIAQGCLGGNLKIEPLICVITLEGVQVEHTKTLNNNFYYQSKIRWMEQQHLPTMPLTKLWQRMSLLE